MNTKQPSFSCLVIHCCYLPGLNPPVSSAIITCRRQRVFCVVSHCLNLIPHWYSSDIAFHFWSSHSHETMAFLWLMICLEPGVFRGCFFLEMDLNLKVILKWIATFSCTSTYKLLILIKMIKLWHLYVDIYHYSCSWRNSSFRKKKSPSNPHYDLFCSVEHKSSNSVKCSGSSFPYSESELGMPFSKMQLNQQCKSI